ncbi:SPW repeat domain-containing protein [Nocardiopsis halotolerans]|uniref:SPW repeat domain-containing protein n=1 Tax=Nocardiopsis halotolerans TaxID=124252 RepID=UPI000348525B|nr:SPW repeat protein [Nocardiopsis halotolerans]
MRRRGRWADWVEILAGLALVASWVWHGMQGLGGGAMFALGVGVVMAAVISLTRPGALTSEMGSLVLGALVFALPWLLDFTGVTAAAWTAWILGGAVVLLGVFGLSRAARDRRRDPDLAWSSHVNEVSA